MWKQFAPTVSGWLLAFVILLSCCMQRELLSYWKKWASNRSKLLLMAGASDGMLDGPTPSVFNNAFSTFDLTPTTTSTLTLWCASSLSPRPVHR